MALMPCSECGKQISSLAVACPQCGAPVSERDEAPSTQQSESGASQDGNRGCLQVALVIAALIAASSIVLVVVTANDAKSDPRSAEQRRDEKAIELCWESHDRRSLEPSSKRFIASACEKMESDFRTQYGREP